MLIWLKKSTAEGDRDEFLSNSSRYVLIFRNTILTVDCQPFVQVLTLWKSHCEPKVSTSESCLSILLQLVLLRALRDVLLVFHGLILLPRRREEAGRRGRRRPVRTTPKSGKRTRRKTYARPKMDAIVRRFGFDAPYRHRIVDGW
jgi:hypothetical protein